MRPARAAPLWTRRALRPTLGHRMKKPPAVIRLTRAEWDAFKRQEAAERMELVRRVEDGELTPWQANQEASLFQPGVFNPVEARTANLSEVVDNLLNLRARTSNDRRKPKTIRA